MTPSRPGDPSLGPPGPPIGNLPVIPAPTATQNRAIGTLNKRQATPLFRDPSRRSSRALEMRGAVTFCARNGR